MVSTESTALAALVESSYKSPFWNFEISELISEQATTEFNALSALTEIRIDETTVQTVFHILAQNLSECCGFSFALGCSTNGMFSQISS